MTKMKKNRRLSKEILGLLALSFFIALFFFQFLGKAVISIIENYLFLQDIVLTEAQYIQLDDWVFNLTFLVSVIFFILLFLFLLGERLSYIHDILKGIHALQNEQEDYVVPIEGANELTQLADSVNYLARTQREIKEKEQMLQKEKDQFIRALSHDIRTPLTSIMAYSDLLSSNQTISPEDQNKYLQLIQTKSAQIKDMTDLLLDGNKRNPEHFDDIRILMEQLAGEFEEMLEEDFRLQTRIDLPALSGTFDVQELLRIFQNLTSNIQKYADPDCPVKLSILSENAQLLIIQENTIIPNPPAAESYQIGLRSIQRIVQNHDGRMDIHKDEENFRITVTLSKI